MATKKTREQLEAIPDPTKKGGPTVQEAKEQAAVEVKPKRGRPKKERVSLPVPPEIVDAMVIGLFLELPTTLAKTLLGVAPQFPPTSAAALGPAFRAWLETLELEVTPGWAFIALWVQTMGAGMAAAVPVAPTKPELAGPAANDNAEPSPAPGAPASTTAARFSTFPKQKADPDAQSPGDGGASAPTPPAS